MKTMTALENPVINGLDMSSPLKRSRYLHLFSKGDNYCLQHSLSLRKVYGGQVLQVIYTLLKDPQTQGEIQRKLGLEFPFSLVSDILCDLKDKGMIIDNNDADLDTYTNLFRHGIALRPIQNMYFLPTNACNLRCRYCFVEDDNRVFSEGYMSVETARKTLEVFARLTREAEKISLTFYGGEPLLNADVVYDSMYYIRELEKQHEFSKPVDVSLLTNGLLVDEKTVSVLKETGTGVSISLDGPFDFHDSVRKDLNGKGSFQKALAGYRLIQESGLNPGVSCTLHRHNIDHLLEITEYIADELRPAGMGFNILLPLIGSGNPVDTSAEFAAEQIIKAFEILRERGIYEDRMMRRITPYTEGGFHFKDCMGVGGQIVVAPDGKVGPCQAFLGFDKFFPLTMDRLHSQIDTIGYKDIYGDDLFNEWNHRFPLNMKGCIDCFAIAVCGGGCPYASHANHQSIWEIDDRICHQAKRIMEWMIWDTHGHMTDIK